MKCVMYTPAVEEEKRILWQYRLYNKYFKKSKKAENIAF